jgi:hypothetical protein
MTEYYQIRPGAAGDIGRKTEHDGTEKPPTPSTTHTLHHVFKVWRGDSIIHCDLFFVISEELKKALKNSDLEGYETDDLIVTKSRKFEQLQPDTELPEFYWFRVTGEPGVDDFGTEDRLWLVVSEDALDTLREATLEHAEVEPYDQSG